MEWIQHFQPSVSYYLFVSTYAFEYEIDDFKIKFIMVDFCGWNNAAPDNGERQELWIRNQGKTKNMYGAGPKVDHTTHTTDGWYVFVSQSVQNRGVAVLQSEPLTPYGTNCFAFYYNIMEAGEFTSSQNKLRVSYWSPESNMTMELANLTNVQTDQWLLFSVTVNKLPQGRFVIETYLPEHKNVLESYSDVAIDDIR